MKHMDKLPPAVGLAWAEAENQPVAILNPRQPVTDYRRQMVAGT